MPRIALLDYGMGNLGSVEKALKKVGAEVCLCSGAAGVSGYDGIILPGVGNFGDGMKNLSERGFIQFILDGIRTGIPFMGICLGMQMLLESSEEAPGVRGLGIFRGNVRRFPDTPGFKIPHVGWNQVEHGGTCPFLKDVPSGSHFYFVHSYYAAPVEKAVTAAETDYIFRFTSVLWRGNVFATQFHPEKSQQYGLTVLENFVSACSRHSGEKI